MLPIDFQEDMCMDCLIGCGWPSHTVNGLNVAEVPGANGPDNRQMLRVSFAACRRPWNRRLVSVKFVDSPNAHTERLGTCAVRGAHTLLGFISNYEDIDRRLSGIFIERSIPS